MGFRVFRCLHNSIVFVDIVSLAGLIPFTLNMRRVFWIWQAADGFRCWLRWYVCRRIVLTIRYIELVTFLSPEDFTWRRWWVIPVLHCKGIRWPFSLRHKPPLWKVSWSWSTVVRLFANHPSVIQKRLFSLFYPSQRMHVSAHEITNDDEKTCRNDTISNDQTRLDVCKH